MMYIGLEKKFQEDQGKVSVLRMESMKEQSMKKYEMLDIPGVIFFLVVCLLLLLAFLLIPFDILSPYFTNPPELDIQAQIIGYLLGSMVGLPMCYVAVIIAERMTIRFNKWRFKTQS
jgi:MFS-type transporter involved in bile tolerance (Atg22 family)